MTERYVTVKGLRLRVSEVGSGDPVLLVNGLGGCLESWQPLTDRMPGRTFVSVDHPGTGLSEVSSSALSMSECADLYAGVLDELGHSRVDVLGFSFGGAVAQEFAHRYPSRTHRLVLVSTAFGLGSVPADLFTLFLVSNPMRYISRQARRLSAPLIYRGRVGRQPEILQTELRGVNAHAADVRGVQQQVRAYARWSSAPWVHTLMMPTLVLGGAEDPMAPVINSTLLAHRIPNAKLVIIPDGGHLVLFDSADKVAPLLEEFMSSGAVAA